MNLDANGLPVQADGDANDQLQRVGMIVTAAMLTEGTWATDIERTCTRALGARDGLQPKRGLFVRYIGGNPNNVSADQLISALAAMITLEVCHKDAAAMFLRMCLRLGFAQNYKDGLDVDTKIKLPDFMLFRALPLFFRASKLLYPFLWIADLYLPLLAIGACLDRNPDHVDDNDTIITLAVARSRMPTPLSVFSCWLYRRLRPWNYGCVASREVVGSGLAITNTKFFKPPYGALRWYHRKESGGNPEIAEAWRPICDKWFTT